MRIFVSACLLGIHCRYDGREKENAAVLALSEKHQLVPFCPEIYGGLPTPREPSEIFQGRVRTKSGKDVTAEYEKGAAAAVQVCQMLKCDCAILQDRSPSCGAGSVHNGLFDGGLVAGDGVTAAALKAVGIPVYTAREIQSGALENASFTG